MPRLLEASSSCPEGDGDEGVEGGGHGGVGEQEGARLLPRDEKRSKHDEVGEGENGSEAEAQPEADELTGQDDPEERQRAEDGEGIEGGDNEHSLDGKGDQQGGEETILARVSGEACPAGSFADLVPVHARPLAGGGRERLDAVAGFVLHLPGGARRGFGEIGDGPAPERAKALQVGGRGFLDGRGRENGRARPAGLWLLVVAGALAFR